MNAGWWLILGLTFASVAGLFASLTLSLYTLSRIRISSRVQDSDHESTNTRVLAILEDVQGHAVAIAFLKSVFRFATAVALVYWTTTMRELATPDTVSMVLGLIATIIVLWVSSTLVPMGVANHAGERV